MTGLYTYEIITDKMRNDRLIHVRLGNDIGIRGWLRVTHVLWYPPVANREELRDLRLNELRISVALSVGVKLSIYDFTS